ncbi:MAG: hypothetical protein JHD32_16245 [Sphingobium sp.]|nr:hypothetical protein [Sphingobium sp.]
MADENAALLLQRAKTVVVEKGKAFHRHRPVTGRPDLRDDIIAVQPRSPFIDCLGQSIERQLGAD